MARFETCGAKPNKNAVASVLTVSVSELLRLRPRIYHGKPRLGLDRASMSLQGTGGPGRGPVNSLFLHFGRAWFAGLHFVL